METLRSVRCDRWALKSLATIVLGGLSLSIPDAALAGQISASGSYLRITPSGRSEIYSSEFYVPQSVESNLPLDAGIRLQVHKQEDALELRVNLGEKSGGQAFISNPNDTRRVSTDASGIDAIETDSLSEELAILAIAEQIDAGLEGLD
jgi:hypothetical protein